MNSLHFKQKQEKQEKSILDLILEEFKKGQVFEEFYNLFSSNQTDEILNGNNRSIDNITLDRYVFITLDLEKVKKYKQANDDFIKFLSSSHEKITAFNLRKKTSSKMMSNALNIINTKKRIDALVEAWFTAPDGSVPKILIMRKILQNYFQIGVGGKNLSCLETEKKNQHKKS